MAKQGQEREGMKNRNVCALIALLTALAIIASVFGLFAYFASYVSEESIVKEYILDHATEPDAVKFIKWGPHDLNDEIGVRWPLYSMTLEGSFAAVGADLAEVQVADDEDAPRRDKGFRPKENMPKTKAMSLATGKVKEYGKPVLLIRVVYRESLSGRVPAKDMIFFVQYGKVVLALSNEGMGSAWKEMWKEIKKRSDK